MYSRLYNHAIFVRKIMIKLGLTSQCLTLNYSSPKQLPIFILSDNIHLFNNFLPAVQPNDKTKLFILVLVCRPRGTVQNTQHTCTQQKKMCHIFKVNTKNVTSLPNKIEMRK